MAEGSVGSGRRCWADVAVAHHRSVRAFEAAVQPVLDRFRLPDLGIGNLLFLVAVGREGRRISDMVKVERYAGSNASYAMDALTRERLIERHRDPADKRMRVVVATARGRRLIDHVARACAGDEAEVMAALDMAARCEVAVACVEEAEKPVVLVQAGERGMAAPALPSLSGQSAVPPPVAYADAEGALA